MPDFSLTLVLRLTTSKIINDMAKVQIKPEKITPFGGIFHVRVLFPVLWLRYKTSRQQDIKTTRQDNKTTRQFVLSKIVLLSCCPKTSCCQKKKLAPHEFLEAPHEIFSRSKNCWGGPFFRGKRERGVTTQ